MDPSEHLLTEHTLIFVDWDKQSKFLKQQFPLLTDHDLCFEQGKEVELFTKLEARLYKNREEVIVILKKAQEHNFPVL